jgi:quercetin dioxygenase-like cupin family protein
MRRVSALALSTVLAVSATAQDKKPMVVVPFQDARFVPIDPARPDGAQMAVLSGDPNTGPSATLLRLKKGPSVLHVHSSDYHLVVIQGRARHWGEGHREADAVDLGPGSYWFQPGQEPHAGSCLTDECLYYVQWAGKRDGRPAPAAR